MKTHAYYQNDLGEMVLITGYKVHSLEIKEPGRWKRRNYYSTHNDPTHRRLMHFKQRNNKKYFAYNPTPGNQGEDPYSTHESLCHLLFKRALSKLKSTTFIFNNQGSLKLTIKKTEMEKSIKINGKTFRCDLYIEFATNQEKKLGWRGHCYVEVTFKNRTEGKKLESFSDHFLPLVEVNISEKLAYENSPESSTPEKEDAYVDRMVRYLSSFVYVKILSDPETRQDLIKKHHEMATIISHLKEKELKLKAENTRLNRDLQKLNELLEIKQNHTNELNTVVKRLQDENNRITKKRTPSFRFNPIKSILHFLSRRKPKD